MIHADGDQSPGLRRPVRNVAVWVAVEPSASVPSTRQWYRVFDSSGAAPGRPTPPYTADCGVAPTMGPESHRSDVAANVSSADTRSRHDCSATPRAAWWRRQVNLGACSTPSGLSR